MLLSLLLALASGFDPATAAPPASDAQSQAPAAASAADPAKKAAPSSSEKLVCHSEIVTGSRFPKRVCVRADELAQKRLDDQTRVRSMQQITGGQYH